MTDFMLVSFGFAGGFFVGAGRVLWALRQARTNAICPGTKAPRP